MIRRLFMTVLTAAVCLAPAGAAAGPEKRVSLREALELALRDNPEIRATQYALAARREDIGIARGSLLPRIALEERFLRTNNPTYSFMAKLNQERFSAKDFEISSLNNPIAINDFQTAFSIEQPLFNPRAAVGVDLASKEYEASSEGFSRTREEVAARVYKTYLGIQSARAYVAVSEKNVEDAREHLRIAAARYDAELGLYSDVLRAEASVASAEEKLVSARKGLEVAKRALGLMLGLASPVDADDERPAFEAKALDYYVEAASSRKDLKAMEARYSNAENRLRMANGGYLPVIGVGGSYQLNSHEAPLGVEGSSWQLTAFLRWDLFDGGRREHERRKAGFSIAEAAEHLEGLRKQVSFEVYEAYLGVEESRKGLELARAGHRAAEEGKRLVKTRYENSLSPMVDLLDVQTSLDASRAAVVAKEAAYLTAISELCLRSGTILKDLGLEE